MNSTKDLPTPKKGASVEGITEFTFPNGMRVLLFPDETKHTVTVNVTYFVGSRHEGYGETGMAHLLEHLMFKGTPNTPNVPEVLSQHGARANGTTWLDRTNYYETVTATRENLEWAIRFEADRMLNSHIAKKDLDSEMTVVRNEFESGENNAPSILLERTLSAAFLWHNYGNSTIGARSDIENVPIDRLRAFYRHYYQPDNAVVIVAGKFDEAVALQVIADTFGKMPRPERQLPRTYTSEPAQDGERLITLRRVGGEQALTAAYHVPSGTHEDFAAVDVLAGVLGETPGGRLYKALVETKKATSVRGFAFLLREPGVLVVTVRVPKEKPLDVAREALLESLEQMIVVPVTPEEVDRVRAARNKNIELTLNESDRVGLNLSEWAASGDWRMLFIHRDRLRKVTAADVQRVAKEYLKSSNRTLGMFVPTDNPDRAEIPPVPDISGLVEGYTGEAPMAAGEAFEPTPGNIESRTSRSRLSNGFKLALLPKKTRGEKINIQLCLRFGAEKSLTNRETVASAVGRMLLRGTKKRTRQQIKDAFDRLKAQVSVSAGIGTLTATVEVRRPQLDETLNVLAEVLREPAFDAQEWERLRAEALTQLEAERTEPTSLGNIAFRRQVEPYPRGHPRYTPTIEEQISDTRAATVDEARAFYSQLYGADHGELAAVGDFDATQLRRFVADVFGAWNSPERFEHVTRRVSTVEPKVVVLETPDKPNAFFLAGLTFELRDDDPDYPALTLGNYLMGGGFLNSRLATRIRQKEGLSYGVGSVLNASAIDRFASFVGHAIYAPENVGKLETAFREEINLALEGGFTAGEFEKARTGLLQSREVQRAQDGSLASTLASYLFVDRTFAFDTALEKKLQELTPRAVVEAMRKYLNPQRISVVKAGDFAKKSSSGKS